MITLETLEPRILQVLEDTSGKRFDSGTLEEAIRQALDLLDRKLPNIAVSTFTVSDTGRDQAIDGLTNWMYLVSLCLNPESSGRRELEPESEFTYRTTDGQPLLHFSGRRYPNSGDILRVTYAAKHSLSGLDDATETTLSDACTNALVCGAAGQACLLRAGFLSEAYGARPAEATRLLEMSRSLMERFEQSLTQFKALQEFGFPPGFVLDADDRRTGRC